MEGRILVLNIALNELINVYGPNKDDITFLKKIETFCNGNEYYILGGDFNLVIDPNLDKNGGITILILGAGQK